MFSQQTELFASDMAPYAYFGADVSLGNNNLVIGSPNSLSSTGMKIGQAYIFSKGIGSLPWSQVALLVASDSSENSQFGISVSYDNTRNSVAVGSPFAGISCSL